MYREVLDFYEYAMQFLDASAEGCLRAFAATLFAIRDSAALANSPPDQVNRSYPWRIPGHAPLLTKPSKDYERGERKGGLEIIGELTTIWEITPDPKKSNRDTPKQFRLTGNASVVVRWLEVETMEPVGQWNVDIGAPDSPGCMFHTQYPGIEIPVPRHPCIAFTPMAVAEHVLGELFQDRWVAHSQTGGAARDSWRGIQKRRLTQLLEWQLSLIKNCECPPWAALKTERIPADRFMANR